MRRAPMALLLGLLGCEAAEGPPDAAQCSVSPPPTVAPVAEAAILFDVYLPGHWYVAGIFPDGDEVVVFTVDTVHHVSADGTVSSAPHALDGATFVELSDVAPGPGGYGALARIIGDDSDAYYLCILDAAGAFQLDRCVETHPFQRIVSDGSGYRTYKHTEGVLERRRFDPTPALVTMEQFPVPDQESGSVYGVVATPAGDHVVAEDYVLGESCRRIRAHVITPDDQHRIHDLAPPDVIADDEPLGIVAGDDGGVSIFVVGACRTAECRIAPDTSTPLLSTYEAGEPALVAEPMAADVVPRVVLRDGSRTVTVGSRTTCYEESPTCERCYTRAELARYGPDGRAELLGVEVVPSRDGFSLQLAGAVMGPGDYVIAYAQQGLMLTRVLVP